MLYEMEKFLGGRVGVFLRIVEYGSGLLSWEKVVVKAVSDFVKYPAPVS